MTQDLQTKIDGTDAGTYAFVDLFDGTSVWVSVNVIGGGARMVMTYEEAKKMAEALNRIIEAGNAQKL